MPATWRLLVPIKVANNQVETDVGRWERTQELSLGESAPIAASTVPCAMEVVARHSQSQVPTSWFLAADSASRAGAPAFHLKASCAVWEPMRRVGQVSLVVGYESGLLEVCSPL